MEIVYLTNDQKSWLLVCKKFYPSYGSGKQEIGRELPDGERVVKLPSAVVEARKHTRSQRLQEINKEKPDTYHTIKIAGNEVKIPRYQQAYGKSYAYSGTVSPSKEMIPLIEKIKDKIIKKLNKVKEDDIQNSNFQYNMCLVNWYPDGNHYIGPHSDDESQLVDNSTIASVSWGETRTFKLEKKSGVKGTNHTILLEDGDLVVMGGTCQKTHKHSVPKCKTDKERINFTFRVFK